MCDDETLLSVVTSDYYISADGQIEPTFFDKRISDGMSVDRKRYTSLPVYDLRASRLVEANEKKTNCGSVEIAVSIIRKIKHRGVRAIAVYDTAFSDNIAHAEIACTEVPPKGTEDRKRLRAKLRMSVLQATLHNRRVLTASELFDQLVPISRNRGS
ncbi:MAG: hypothetical protein OXC63_14165 [Aestuariivita sp.]|nr:hypothetical protein [Aestuariivita sp.]